jgi:hypothetical protein
VKAVSLRGGNKLFTAHLAIRKDARCYVDETIFHPGQTFSDANAALEAGIEIGKKKIDEGFTPIRAVVNQ